jgi:prepilin-type N-terminal cleavage/methylation domain-containing protein
VKTRTPMKRHRGPAGVSLVELVIVLAIVGVIATGMYSLFVTTLDTYSDQAVNARMLQNATSAMKQITQDLRSGGTFYAPACAGITGWPTAVASTSTASTLTIATLLDGPAARTELASSQARTTATLGVLSVTGWATNDVAYLTDGAQCARFTVTTVVASPPGLTHVPADDAYLTGGAAYIYPAATSMVYRVGLSQTITYDLDTSDPNITWLRRNSRRLAPDIQSLAFGYVNGSGGAVSSPLTAVSAPTVRAVTVNLQVRGDKLDPSVRPNVAGGYRTQRLTSTVQLRNFGS